MLRRLRFAFCTAIIMVLWATYAFSEVPPIVVEARCASSGTYVEGGTGWENSSAKSQKTSCSNGSRSTKNSAAWADFIPTIETEGTYHIYLTWGATTANNKGPNAENVEVSILDGNGTQNVLVNMRGNAGCASANADQLVYVGQGHFTPGSGHKVRVSNVANGQCYNGPSKRFVNADALLLEFVSPLPTLPASWGFIKARYLD